ncbi:MAG: 50S ribosomal protein L10 [Bacteroidetes bacterium]|nr:50S ribosomal protein L10 [Bacteroidota bacterium]MCB9226680.1 50S ribosomal protein L10 [Chitinophagales bacterium]
MTREEKNNELQSLTEQIAGLNSFYLADSSTLNVAKVNALRGLCFEKGVKIKVVKNTLLKKALEASENDFDQLIPLLKGPTSLMYSEEASASAKVIKKFREDSERPVLKGAFIEGSFYIGDQYVNELASLKSKEELIGDVIGLLQAPAVNLISALSSGGTKIHGILQTLSEKE